MLLYYFRAREEEEKTKLEFEERQRRPSRFEVLPAPDILSLRQIATDEMLPPQAKKRQEAASSLPKSILKKTNSFNLKGFNALTPHSPTMTPYTTITGSEYRIRNAFEAIFKKSATLADVKTDQEGGSQGGSFSCSINLSLHDVDFLTFPNSKTLKVTFNMY